MIRISLALIVLSIIISGCATIDPQSDNGLEQLSCSKIEGIRSVSGRDKVVVRFSNTQDEDLSLYWLDYKGKEIHYKTLKAGESYSQATYLTHPWVARNESQECVGIFTPHKQNFKVVL